MSMHPDLLRWFEKDVTVADTTALLEPYAAVKDASYLTSQDVCDPKVEEYLSTVKEPKPAEKAPLSPQDVKHLALEGGGGKGLAYVGALQALAAIRGGCDSAGRSGKPTLLEGLDAVSGASAGAITALFVALGFSVEEMQRRSMDPGFVHFDTLDIGRLIPRVGDWYDRVAEDSTVEKDWIERLTPGLLERLEPRSAGGGDVIPLGDWLVIVLDVLSGAQPKSLAEDNEFLAVGRALVTWLGNVLMGAVGLGDFQRNVARYLAMEPLNALVKVKDLPRYLAYLNRDMGLFSGESFRNRFNDLIWDAINFRLGPEASKRRHALGHYVTFRTLSEAMKEPPARWQADNWARTCPELILTGSNLATGRTELFSTATTPDFPVADAVRISMGLPVFFKPYVLDERRPGWPPRGTYVDGGLWNNLPYREFGSTQRDTLSMRLEIVQPTPVTTMGTLLGRLGTFGLFGTGESQVLEQYAKDQILLDTHGLALFPFTAPPETLATIRKRSARAVYDFWSIPVPEKYRDLQDEAYSHARRKEAENYSAR